MFENTYSYVIYKKLFPVEHFPFMAHVANIDIIILWQKRGLGLFYRPTDDLRTRPNGLWILCTSISGPYTMPQSMANTIHFLLIADRTLLAHW